MEFQFHQKKNDSFYVKLFLPKTMDSNTKNTKDNRKVVVARYSTKQVFKIPDNIDLQDENVVESWTVRWGTLYIYYKDGTEQTFADEYEVEPDYKEGTIEIEDAEDWNVEYSQDEEEEEGTNPILK